MTPSEYWDACHRRLIAEVHPETTPPALRAEILNVLSHVERVADWPADWGDEHPCRLTAEDVA